jgi:hypothetical protein
MSTPTETPIDQPDAGDVRFFITHKPNPDQVELQVCKILHEHGEGEFTYGDSSTGYTYPDWDAAKTKVVGIMSEKVVTTGTAEDKAENSIIPDELYVAVLGEDAPGANGEELPLEVSAAVDSLKGKFWGYCNKGTSGHVNHQQKDLVMVEEEVSRPSIDPRTGRTSKIKVRGRFLTANPKVVSLQAENVIEKILDDAYRKANNYAKMVGDRIPELAVPLAKKSAAISKAAAKKFTYSDPTYVAELHAGAGTHFDPVCVEAFDRIRPQLEILLEREASERRGAETGMHTLSRQELERERAAAFGNSPQSVTRTVFPEKTKTHAPVSVPAASPSGD